MYYPRNVIIDYSSPLDMEDTRKYRLIRSGEICNLCKDKRAVVYLRLTVLEMTVFNSKMLVFFALVGGKTAMGQQC